MKTVASNDLAHGRGRRLAAVGLLLFLSFGALGLQAFLIQVVQHDDYMRQANDERAGKTKLLAKRGAIKDRNGYILADTVTTYKVFLYPQSLTSFEDKSRVARSLGPLLNLPEARVLEVLSAPDRKRTLLKDAVPREVGLKLQRLSLPGVELVLDPRRYYPEGSLAASLLGVVGQDGGLSGVEADFDPELTGTPGTMLYERDTAGDEIPVGGRVITQPVDGTDLVLTIDRYVQRLIESELEAVLQETGADSGLILVQDPSTGAILGMANRPTFDLKNPDLSSDDKLPLLRNVAVTDPYEPGSVFKVVTMSAALEEGKITPDTPFYDSGVVEVNGVRIYNNDRNIYGQQSMTDILVNSSNVGTVHVSELLGPDLFYRYVKGFGFGQPTNCNLGGESAGIMRTPKDKEWARVDLANNSFGQGISATPLQVISAVSAIGNGGKLMRPYVVERHGTDGPRTEPRLVRQVISDSTARQVTGMMEQVVERGLANQPLAQVPGYTLAGKTGTSDTATAAGYDTTKVIASFAGFAPARQPRFTILIVVDRPQGAHHGGGTVAAPVFERIARDLLTYYRVPPDAPTTRG